ncbi:hypothetical protein AB1K54_00320 [Microbacterium sp. BWT-B31]|uniref:hypothetical protein n=1 Tax=Microbacterium sp. BWT-B31 TaxID=3232072 RepID=UPI0035274308
MITVHKDGLVFDPLGADAWRLCDTGIDEHDARRLVAYVERTAHGGYEAIWMEFGAPPSEHATREDIVRCARELPESASRSPTTKPAPVPHLPPLRLHG